MFQLDKAKGLLKKAGVFYHNRDVESEDFGPPYTLNLNDTWGWACADGETILESELPRVAELFWKYGHCGILYWASELHQPPLRSEFHDINRFIEFVRHEEELKKQIPDSSKRAYTRITYELGK